MAALTAVWKASWAWLAAGVVGLAGIQVASMAVGAWRGDIDALRVYSRRAVKVAVTSDHACALMTDHSVSCWGVLPASLGGSTDLAQHVPNLRDVTEIQLMSRGTRVFQGDKHRDWGVLSEQTKQCKLVGDAVSCQGEVGLRGVTSLVNGNTYSCALRSDHTVWCWGKNSDGELGDGTTSSWYVPQRVDGLDGIVAIYGGDFQMFAVSSTGQVSWWGRGTGWGRSMRPRVVPELEHATSMSVTTDFGCAVVGDGVVKCWGSGRAGVLGLGGVQQAEHPMAVLWERPSIESLGVPGGARVTSVAMSGSTSCATLDDRSLWCWGEQLGQPQLQPLASSRPRQVRGIDDAVRVIDDDGMLVQRLDGSWWLWRRLDRPRRVGEVEEIKLPESPITCRIAADRAATCCIGDRCGPPVAQAIRFDEDAYGGAWQSPVFATTADGRHWCLDKKDLTWGEGRHCVTGETPELRSGCSVVDGDAECWGSNSAGQLGNGTAMDHERHTRVMW